MDWYRAWVGACSDEKISEAKIVSGLPRSLLIALWHALLESACRDEQGGAFSATPRRLSAVIEEPVERIEAGLTAFAEVGLIDDGEIVAWAKRQPNSETPAAAAERQRRRRERGRGEPEPAPSRPVTASHGVSRRVTAPESESETELSSSSGAPARAGEPEIDLGKVVPLGREPLEAEARALMDGSPVVLDPDFSPISALLDEPGVTRADLLAGLADARAAPQFRPVSWRQCAGWVRRAAKNRLAAAMAASGVRARPPPRASPRAASKSALAVCLEIARGNEPDPACATAGLSAADAARPRFAAGA